MEPMPSLFFGMSGQPLRLSRRHVLMLALALEILIAGSVHADRSRRSGVTVEAPVNRAHVIT